MELIYIYMWFLGNDIHMSRIEKNNNFKKIKYTNTCNAAIQDESISIILLQMSKA